MMKLEFLKRLLLPLLGLALALVLGSHLYVALARVSEGGVLRVPTADILTHRETKPGVIQYVYNTRVKYPRQSHNGYPEDISRRTTNTMTFLEGKDAKGSQILTHRIYLANRLLPDVDGHWYLVAFATTTKEIFFAEANGPIARLLGVKPTYASTTLDRFTSSDAWIQNSGANFSTVRTAASGNFVDTTGTELYAQSTYWNSSYWLSRNPLIADTGSLPDTLTTEHISNAKLCLYAETQSFGSDDGDSVNVVSYTGATTTPGTADFDAFGTTSFAAVSFTGLSAGYNCWGLSEAGEQQISLTGFTALGLVNTTDLSGTAPTGSNQATFRTLEATGENKDPYYEITYTAPGSAGPQYQLPTADDSYYGDTVTSVAFVNLTPGDFVFCNHYHQDAAGNCKADLADADTASTMPAFGRATGYCTAGNSCTFLVRGYWRDNDDNWSMATATSGRFIYPSTTAGADTQTASVDTGDQIQRACRVVSSDVVWCDFDDTVIEI